MTPLWHVSLAALAVLVVSVCAPAAHLAGVASAPALVSPGTLHGRLDQTWVIRDRGVAHVATSRTQLQLELQTEADGLVVLRARGQRESSAFFMTEDATPTRTTSAIDERWTGRWVGAVLRLERLDGDPRALVHELRCARASEPVDGAAMELLRCEPITGFTGMPWNDPLPPYLRVPLVLALRGDVQATISGGEEGPPQVTLARVR